MAAGGDDRFCARRVGRYAVCVYALPLTSRRRIRNITPTRAKSSTPKVAGSDASGVLTTRYSCDAPSGLGV